MRPRLPQSLISIAVGLSLTTGMIASRAEDPAAPAANDVASLTAVVVTANRERENIDQVAASVSVIKASEIQGTSSQELDEALRLVPGIDLMGYTGEAQHPTSDSLGMRGLGGGAEGISRALVLQDGIPLNDGFFGYIQWGRVGLNDVAQVEVVRGGGSPLWGNYAEGGVIQILTKAPAAGESHFDASMGSYATYRADADTALATSASNTVQASVSLTGTDGAQEVPAYERTPFNVPTSYHTINARVRDRLQLGGDDEANVGLSYHENHQRLQTLLDDNYQRIVTFTAQDIHHLGQGYAVSTSAFLSSSDFTTNNSTYYPVAGALATTTQALNEIHHVQYSDLGASIDLQQREAAPGLGYMIGADVRRIGAADHTEHFVDPNFNPADFHTASAGNQMFLGAFARATWNPVRPFEASLSGRWQYLRDSNGVDGSLGGAGAIANQTYSTFDPRLDLRYALNAGWALRAAAYDSFRAPNISDMFYTYAAGGFMMAPSPTLQPEKLHGGELGLDYSGAAMRAQVSLYRTRINNYLITEATNNPIYSPAGWYVVQNQNIADVLAQGIEAELQWKLGGGFTNRLAYTLANSTVRNNPLDPASVGQQLIDVARNRASEDLSYQSANGWRAATQVFWVDRTAWASPDHTSPGFPGALSADPHLLVDVSAARSLTQRIEAYAQVQNLFNRHAVVTSYSAPSPQTYGTPLTLFVGLRGSL